LMVLISNFFSYIFLASDSLSIENYLEHEKIVFYKNSEYLRFFSMVKYSPKSKLSHSYKYLGSQAWTKNS
jgi:hypothetical protein